MKKIYLLFTLLTSAYVGTNHVKAQVTNTAGTTVTILSGTNVTLLQNLSNAGTFTGNTGAPNSKLIMAGAAAQTISGTSVVNLGDFDLNNTVNLVTNTNAGAAANQGSIRVAGTLTFVGANNKLQTSDLSPISFVAITATNPAETNTAHILGTAIMESRTFNVAAVPIFLGFSAAAGADVGNLVLTRRSGATGIVNPVGFNSIAAHWTVAPTNNVTRNITISWFAAWDNLPRDLTQMQLWHTNNNVAYNAPTPWIVINPVPVDMTTRTHTSATGAVLRNSWTVSDFVQPLPVELMYFSAKEQNKNALLNWQTVSETNTNSFDVERSVDGENFERIANVASKNAPSSYNFVDKNLYNLGAEYVYYRLKVLDNDNSFKYSRKESIKLNNKSETVGIYPNPFSDNLFIKINLSQTQNTSIKITDVLGREVYNYQNSLQNISLELNKELSDLAKGAYFVHIITEKSQKIVKIVKQ